VPTTTTSPDFPAVLAARRAYISAAAPCMGCGATRAFCDALREQNTDPSAPGFGCCGCAYNTGVMDWCQHQESRTLHDKLLDEVASGTVRTVEEAYPPSARRATGPVKAPISWLIDQGEWWQPKVGPMVRIATMTDTHRLHLMRWLERRAPSMATLMMWNMASGPQPSGDAACDAFEAEMDLLQDHPVEWLHTTELYRALARGMPSPDGGKRSRKRWGKLLRRAEHYSTCPANRDLKAECRCGPEANDEVNGPGLEPGGDAP
jgi:hypothetical protein